MCCDSWGRKESDMTERLNGTEHLKQLEKEEMKNPKVSKRKEILEIRAEINAKETKSTKPKAGSLKG